MGNAELNVVGIDFLANSRAGPWGHILEALPDGVSIHSTDGCIQYANGTVAAIYGRTPNDLVGLNCAEVFHEASEACPHAEALTTRQRVQVEAGKNGRAYRITIDPVIGDGGEVCGYVRVIRDVTEALRTQESLLRAERFATLGQMISGIAHDLGTPLSIISGYSEYLLMRTMPGGQGYKELSTILDQARRIAEFIRQLLDLAQPDQGRTDAIGLNGFLGELLDMMGHHLRQSSVRATLVCKVKPPLIYGDAPRLRQAFFNLILNASQRVGAGGELEIVLAEAVAENSLIEVLIKGTESNGQSHDFLQSFSGFLHPERGDGASGLGLSLAREIFRGFGARVDSIDSGGFAGSLAIYLPIIR